MCAAGSAPTIACIYCTPFQSCFCLDSIGTIFASAAVSPIVCIQAISTVFRSILNASASVPTIVGIRCTPSQPCSCLNTISTMCVFASVPTMVYNLLHSVSTHVSVCTQFQLCLHLPPFQPLFGSPPVSTVAPSILNSNHVCIYLRSSHKSIYILHFNHFCICPRFNHASIYTLEFNHVLHLPPLQPLFASTVPRFNHVFVYTQIQPFFIRLRFNNCLYLPPFQPCFRLYSISTMLASAFVPLMFASTSSMYSISTMVAPVQARVHPYAQVQPRFASAPVPIVRSRLPPFPTHVRATGSEVGHRAAPGFYGCPSPAARLEGRRCCRDRFQPWGWGWGW